MAPSLVCKLSGREMAKSRSQSCSRLETMVASKQGVMDESAGCVLGIPDWPAVGQETDRIRVLIMGFDRWERPDLICAPPPHNLYSKLELKCRNVLFNRTTVTVQKRMGFSLVWRPRMAAPCYRAAAPEAARS